MTRVPWPSLTAGEVETIVCVLLGREKPRAVRVRPGQGDGGLDLIDPLDHPNADIHQVKSFATALTASRRSQIERSLRAAADNPSVLIRDWYLTLPLNPTPSDLEWFHGLTRDVAFSCHWYGLDRLESLAAAHQDVVDYYIGDGRARLEASIDQLRALAGLGGATASGHLVEPNDTSEQLADLYRLLNRDDPHYRYEFEVGEQPPPAESVVNRPYLVASQSMIRDGVAVTHHIYARYRHATDDRPIPLTFTVRVDLMDNDVLAAWTEAIRYGSGVTLPPPLVTDLHFGLPGGLEVDATSGYLRVGPAHHDEAQPYRLRLRVVDPTGSRRAEVVLAMDPVTHGMSRSGWRAHGHAPANAFEIELFGDLDPESSSWKVRFGLTVGSFSGEAPAALRPGVRFLAELHHPNQLEICPEYGPAPSEPYDIPEAESPITDMLVELIEALADIQEQACSTLVTPSLDDLRASDVASILEAGRLVRGETITKHWATQTISFTPTRVVDDGPIQLALSGSAVYRIGDQDVTLAPLTSVLLAANLSVETTSDGALLHATPALGNNTMTIVLAPIEAVPPVNVDVARPDNDA